MLAWLWGIGQRVSGGDRPPMKRYLVRAAVHDVLMKWNVAHKMPLIEEPLKR